MSWKRKALAELDPEMILAHGLDHALIGHIERCGQPNLAVYDVDKVLALLVRGGMDHEEAVEYFCFNISGAWVGEGTPAWFTRLRRP